MCLTELYFEAITKMIQESGPFPVQLWDTLIHTFKHLNWLDITGCNLQSPRSPNVSVCVCVSFSFCPSHLLQLYWTSEGLLKDFQRTSKGLLKDFQRTSKGLWTLWSTKFISLQDEAPMSSRLVKDQSTIVQFIDQVHIQSHLVHHFQV